MTQQKQIYKCEVCGNIVEVLHTGVGQLVCCGQPMKLQAENTVDAALPVRQAQGGTVVPEKHVPVIEKTSDGVRVKVGSVPHPMEQEHYIEWIEVIVNGRSYRKFLQPGDAPEAEFAVTGEQITAREYCNLHGLWKG